MGNYRRSVFGKVFADILLERLKRIAEKVYPQSQPGNRASRGTIDGIFMLRQLMEKTREQGKNMHIIAFVDFTKAFDSVNRDLFLLNQSLSVLSRNCILMYMQGRLWMEY